MICNSHEVIPGISTWAIDPRRQCEMLYNQDSGYVICENFKNPVVSAVALYRIQFPKNL